LANIFHPNPSLAFLKGTGIAHIQLKQLNIDQIFRTFRLWYGYCEISAGKTQKIC
jgi:hypothetical protein